VISLAAGQAMAALSAADRTFAEKAAVGGMAEVASAQLAQQKAISPQVKQFAAKMLADHSQANTELQQIARQENITLPSQPDRKHVMAERDLNKLTGPSFDKAYVQEQVRDHEETVALFRQQATSGQDPALKAFAQKTLPILQQHLQMAEGMKP
jgi:putative membrane protein